MHCDDCGWECECESEEHEPFIGPMNAPVEGPPTLERYLSQYLSNQIAQAIFAPSDGPKTITGLTAVVDGGQRFGGW